jgi:vacuolar-type H+-ATPase subunit I/STV1
MMSDSIASASTAAADIDFVAAFTSRRAQCLALRTLSQQQSQFDIAAEPERLLELIHVKQELIDELFSVDQGQQLLSAWKSTRDQLPTARRSQCEQLLSEAQSLLAEVLATEDRVIQTVRTLCDRTASELRQVHTAASVHHEYHRSAEDSGPRRLDCDL